jgi:hypothetical protein
MSINLFCPLEASFYNDEISQFIYLLEVIWINEVYVPKHTIYK